jgi:glutamate/tyrosine decarboxylase-like PLP-dependent enzyme
MDYPKTASGVLVSGGSMANFIGLAVARNVKAGIDVKKEGIQGNQPKMTAYVSSEGHHCLYKAIEILGIGRDYVHWIPVNDDYQMDIEALKNKIVEDRESGYNPFCVIGNAGTVNTGAFDDLKALSMLCRAEDIWFHVDGAFGAWAKLSKSHRGLVEGLESADSLAFDLHKWMYMPYVIGCTLVRDAVAHNLTFSFEADYLEAAGRMGESDYSNSSLGMQLSDHFRALNPWFLLKMDGVDKYARLIQQNINQAYYLAELVKDEPSFELMTPCTLNIVCFRYYVDGLGEEELMKLNKALWWKVYQKGFFFSDTVLDSKFALRVCITNHRTKRRHLEDFVEELVKAGKELTP